MSFQSFGLVSTPLCLFLSNICFLDTFHECKLNYLENILLFWHCMNNRPNWQRDLARIKATWWRKEKGWKPRWKLDNFSNELELSSERGLQNKCELVFNILVINVKAPAHHICTWCDCRWQISQTCYLSSPQLALFFLCVCRGFCFVGKWRRV